MEGQLTLKRYRTGQLTLSADRPSAQASPKRAAYWLDEREQSVGCCPVNATTTSVTERANSLWLANLRMAQYHHKASPNERPGIAHTLAGVLCHSKRCVQQVLPSGDCLSKHRPGHTKEYEMLPD